jgi:hypothetical protein
VQATAADRTLFLVAAAFNWLVAVALVLPGDAAWRLVGMARPDETLFVHLFAALVGVFGLAYLWVGFDPSGKRALVLIAVIGKLCVFPIVLAHHLAGSVPMSLVVAGAGDVVFAVLFLAFVRRTA